MNAVYIDGLVGKVERREAGVFMRLCHKESYFNKTTKDWVKDDSWLTVFFFGKKGDAVEREVEVGDRLMVEAGLTVHPKEGPDSRIRLNGISFMRAAPLNYGKEDEPEDPDAF